jgi:hypothetical protein
LVRATLVLARTNLVAELVFELKMSAFFDALKLLALKCAIVLVLIELGFKKLGDGLESLGRVLSCRQYLICYGHFYETTRRTTQA